MQHITFIDSKKPKKVLPPKDKGNDNHLLFFLPKHPRLLGGADRYLAYDWSMTPGLGEKPGSLVMAGGLNQIFLSLS